MNIITFIQHLVVGFLSGEDKTCGNKIKYGSEEKASKASIAMNNKSTTRSVLEPYPCFFCSDWHIGRKIPTSKLEEISKYKDDLQ